MVPADIVAKFPADIVAGEVPYLVFEKKKHQRSGT
jgi:hypothetical protein